MYISDLVMGAQDFFQVFFFLRCDYGRDDMIVVLWGVENIILMTFGRYSRVAVGHR